MTIFYILGALFIALIIIIPLLERSKTRISPDDLRKISCWILPLIVIVLVLQLLRYMF
jgi:hypothetical protein